MIRYIIILNLLLTTCVQSVMCGSVAERTLPLEFYIQGERGVLVQLSITSDEEQLIIQEIVPPGWSVRQAPGATIEDNTLTWERTISSNEFVIKYYLNAPEVANGDAHFSGMINDIPIGGDSAFLNPTPTPGKQVPLADTYYQYWLYLPADYSDVGEPRPLILFLHCAPVVGNDLELVITNYDVSPLTILNNPENQQIFPELFQSIVVSPLSTVPRWDKNKLIQFLNGLILNYSIDSHRVYLLGVGIGAADGWDFASQYPDAITAFISIILAVPPSKMENLSKVPFWVFQYEPNLQVPIAQIETMVDQIRSDGGSVNSTIFPPETEDLLGDIFGNPDIYRWLLQQNKQSQSSDVSYWDLYY